MSATGFLVNSILDSNATEKRKSLLVTAILFVSMFLLLWLFNYTQIPSVLDLEGGGGGGDIAVNFGDSDVGMGDNFTSMEKVSAAPKPVAAPVASKEEIITSENDDAPVIANIRKPAEKPVKTEVVKPIVKPVVKPQPSKSTNDALDAMMNGSDKSGDGNDKVGGNKGKSYGDPNATGYNGGGGSGTGSGGGNGSGQGIGTGSGYGSGSGGGRGTGNGNYQLAGRKALNKPAPAYNCNEQGQVAVKIWVDRNGNVTRAEAGDRGTTNAASCLATQAVLAAKATRWEANSDSPETQVGKIIYSFKLTQ